MTDGIHTDRSVELLQQLGLKEYEARCFVALSRLSEGTAKLVSEVSEVPRTRVYDAIDALESRGLVEVEHANPKRFRAVPVTEAVSTLRSEFETVTENLRGELRDLEAAETADDDRVCEVWSLSGRTAIANRTERLVGDAGEEVVLAIGVDDAVTEELLGTLRERRVSGVDVLVGATAEHLRERLASALPDVETLGVGLEWLDDPADDPGAGTAVTRLLVVDRESMLVSAVHEAEGLESAVIGTGPANGLVAVARRVLHAGIEDGAE